MKLTGAQIMMEVLKEEGVDTIFGFPGGVVIDLFDELANREPCMQPTVMPAPAAKQEFAW
jgi:thiamine pyrophosphate-dependent acetolactate synthase large subunit-like protein